MFRLILNVRPLIMFIIYLKFISCINVENEMRDRLNKGRYHPGSLHPYRLVHNSNVHPELRKMCQEHRKRFSKLIISHYKPDYYNCTIEYFEHPETKLPTPNFQINVASDLFIGIKVADRAAALNDILKPILVPPYKLTINARGSVSVEFIDTSNEYEKIKQNCSKDFVKFVKYQNLNKKPLESIMEKKLIEAFDPDMCTINNEWYKYDIPEESETHFSISLVSHKFINKSIRECREMVKEVLREEILKLQYLQLFVDVPVAIPTLLPPTLGWWQQFEYTKNISNNIKSCAI